MSKKSYKRRITDVVDSLLDDMESVEQGDIKQLELDILENYRDHPSALYKEKRPSGTVEDVEKNEILNPIIVPKREDGAYEILSGHNGINVARFTDIKNISCIVKENLSGEQAYTHVIETNLTQHPFSDLLPTERALVLRARYGRIASQGKRNDLQKEINSLEQGIIGRGRKSEDKTDSRETLGKEHSLLGVSITRYFRLNELSNS